MTILPLFRQLLVALSPQLAAFSVGGSVTFPTLLIQQLNRNDSDIHLDMDASSWVGSIYGITGLPAIFMPIIMQWKGRKFSLILTCCAIIIGWFLSYLATNTPMILISESFHGLGTNSLCTVSFLSMVEMLAPRYRLFCMQLFGISQGLGMAVGGIAGRFLHFKTISLIMLAPVITAVLIALLWPESPPWLACKGRFDQCERTFYWLRGKDDVSVKELKELITAQRENLSIDIMEKDKFSWQQFFSKISRRDFYLPSIHTFLLLNMLYWSGGDVILIYFIDMVQKSTQSEDAAFTAGNILYSIVLSGCFVTNVLARYFKNKTILIFSTSGVILCLAGITVVTGLQSYGYVAKDSYLIMYFLIAYMLFNSWGLNGFVFYMTAELMPVKYKNIGGAFLIICNCTLYASSLKISPYLIKYIGMSGTFSLFTVNAITCVLLVFKYVPETKGKTLQELEDYYVFGKFIKRDVGSIDLAVEVEN